MEDLIFIEAKEVRTEYIDGINNLLGQLTSSPKEMNEALLQAIVESDRTHLFLAYIGNQMVGMTTLAAYVIPTGTKAWVEDVVVDNNFRGKHIGKKLVNHVVEYTKKYSPCSLMLTSRPMRVAANKLYQSVGFEKRETNVYKIQV